VTEGGTPISNALRSAQGMGMGMGGVLTPVTLQSIMNDFSLPFAGSQGEGEGGTESQGQSQSQSQSQTQSHSHSHSHSQSQSQSHSQARSQTQAQSQAQAQALAGEMLGTVTDSMDTMTEYLPEELGGDPLGRLGEEVIADVLTELLEEGTSGESFPLCNNTDPCWFFRRRGRRGLGERGWEWRGWKWG